MRNLASVWWVAAALLWASACNRHHTAPQEAPPSTPVPSAPTEDEGDNRGVSLEPVKTTAFRTAVAPKPLASGTRTGLSWLVSHQLPSGGWGQGDESRSMGGGAELRDVANVADTSMALLALMRSGSTPTRGEHSKAVARGLDFILSEIEKSDDDSLYVTEVRGTRVQMKIGTYVDTFTALMVLTEAKGTMPDAQSNARLERGLSKVLAKVEKNQQHDGTWANQGWAPVLSQSLAGKGLNRAAQSGEKVDGQILARVEAQARSQYDFNAGRFASGGGAAGVDLYAGAANTSSLRDSVNTRKTRIAADRKAAKSAPTEEARQAATARIQESQEAEIAADQVQNSLAQRLDDPAFVRGFGNNGGEEFLSYMLVSESLVAKADDEWRNWDRDITKLVLGVQNPDGSWTGHHCITGRTFCTAAALLVLMADRTPVPEEVKIAH